MMSETNKPYDEMRCIKNDYPMLIVKVEEQLFLIADSFKYPVELKIE